MFTAKEKKNIMKLPSRAVDPDYALNLVELHGFLFGIAITPEMIKPSEWLPIAFGEGMMEFENEAEAEELMKHLFAICNRKEGGLYEAGVGLKIWNVSLSGASLRCFDNRRHYKC